MRFLRRSLSLDRGEVSMTKGHTSFRFHGGLMDGQVLEDQPTLYARDILSVPFRAFAAWDPVLGQVSIKVSKTGKLGSDWFMTSRMHYEKKPSQSAGVDYHFVRTIVEGRCAAITQKGSQCRNHALEGSLLCETSHKTGAAVTLIQDEFLLDDLGHLAEHCEHSGLVHLEKAERSLDS